MPDPFVTPRRPLPPRPDPAIALIRAINGRDGVRILRLVEVWVHRRGLDSLHHFWQLDLPASLEPDAMAWLQLQNLVPWSSDAAGFCPGAEPHSTTAQEDGTVGEAEQPQAADPIPGPAPFAPAPEPGIGTRGAEGSHRTVPAAAMQPLPESLLTTAPARARRMLGRARLLLRECLAEVWEGLGGAAASGDPMTTAHPRPVARIPGGTPMAPVVPPPPTMARSSAPAPSPSTPSPSAAVALERLRPPRPRVTVPRLPSATRPAPAPPDLADLRRWLPDPIENLPRAC